MAQEKTVLLCAGGTGGHLFPAEALAHELIERGWRVHLATDDRAKRFADNFPGDIHIIKSATVTGKNPIALAKTAYALFSGYRQSKALILKHKPDIVVGFGGYPTLPPLLAANYSGISCAIHEQNAVLGRANRFLAPRVKTVAVGFDQHVTQGGQSFVLTGNPIRPMVHAVANVAYPVRGVQDPFKLVIFGGSQGAQYFSKVFPEALEKLSAEERGRLDIVQQARPEDEAELSAAYKALGVAARISPFFGNMPEEISKAHFVVSRAGASTVTEIAVIGRPSLLIPYPGSLDGDQAWNALAMQQMGGADLVEQKDLDADLLASKLKTALNQPKELALVAKNAKKTGKPDAASRLADCIENLL